MIFTYEPVINALGELCKQHKDLGNGLDGKFFRFDTEFKDAMRNTAGFVMLLQPFEARLHGQNESSIYKTYTLGFSILKANEVGQHEDQMILTDDCETIAMQILSRIRYYTLNIEGTPTAFPHFSYTSITGKPIKLEADNRIGWDVTFEIHAMISMAFDTDDADEIWADLP